MADPKIEKAITEAERLYRDAVRRYRKNIGHVCNQRVSHAAESLKESGRMVEKALRGLARPICRRLGLDKGDASTVCHVLHDIGMLDREASDRSPGMLEHVLKDIPRREPFDKWLVDDGRKLLYAFERAARLDLDSGVGGRLRDLIRSKYSYSLPEEENHPPPLAPTPPPVTSKAGRRKNPAERALARAAKLLAKAESACREVVAALCTPTVTHAEEKAYKAAEIVEEAMKIACAPVLARLGVHGDVTWFRPDTFVDGASWQAIERLGHAIIAGKHAFFELLEIPDRETFHRELIDRPREAVEMLTHIARLPADSAELRALRAAVGKPVRRRRRRAARSKVGR